MKALIVGGSGGIGSTIALAYAKTGFDVVITYYENSEKAEKIAVQARAEGAQASTAYVDTSNDQSVKALYEQIDSLDVVVFAVAQEKPLGADEANYEDWRSVTGPMIDGAHLCTHYAIPLLKKSENPNIIYIPSTDGIRPNGEYIAYQVSEAALIALTIGNAKHLARKYKIRVNAVCPGPVRTALWDKAGDNTDAMWSEFARNNPLGRNATAEDIAQACLTLSQDPGKYLNGNFLSVNGEGFH